MQWIHVLIEWIKGHIPFFYLLGGISLSLTIITIIVVPLFLIYVPRDFFINEEHNRRFGRIPFTMRIILIILKNITGVIIIAAGALMLILPGQGIITILIGVFLVDFPGKKRLLFYILRKPIVLNTINWIRKKNKRKDLIVEEGTG
jgi:hypothetical protein